MEKIDTCFRSPAGSTTLRTGKRIELVLLPEPTTAVCEGILKRPLTRGAALQLWIAVLDWSRTFVASARMTPWDCLCARRTPRRYWPRKHSLSPALLR
jgi:hypothetical protein